MPGASSTPQDPDPASSARVAPLSSRRLVGLLAEPDRRRVVAALILDADTPDTIASLAGLDLRQVVDSLERLANAGLVEEIDGRHHLLAEAFKMAARHEAEAPAPSEFGDEAEPDRRILDRAVSDGRLTRLPAKWSHKLVVLDWVAQRFEPGVRYTERQVNATLATIHDDTATLRRYLVDAKMMDRADGEYWRSGGRVATD